MNTAAPDLEGRLFITVTELAALLQLDPRTIRRGIQDGSIPAVRVGRSTRIPVPKIRTLIGLDRPAPAMDDDRTSPTGDTLPVPAAVSGTPSGE